LPEATAPPPAAGPPGPALPVIDASDGPCGQSADASHERSAVIGSWTTRRHRCRVQHPPETRGRPSRESCLLFRQRGPNRWIENPDRGPRLVRTSLSSRNALDSGHKCSILGSSVIDPGLLVFSQQDETFAGHAL